jgi:hypothetical protein
MHFPGREGRRIEHRGGYDDRRPSRFPAASTLVWYPDILARPEYTPASEDLVGNRLLTPFRAMSMSASGPT